MRRRIAGLVALTALIAPLATASQSQPAAPRSRVHINWGFLTTRDGTRLEYRETTSTASDPRLPAILHYQGSGPSTLTQPLLDVLYEPMLDLGFTVFTIHKRGVRRDPADPTRDKVDEHVYASLGVRMLLSDAEDAARFILRRSPYKRTGILCFGQSEGTLVAVHLAEALPREVRAVFGVGTQIIVPGLMMEEQFLEGIAARTLKDYDADRDGRLQRSEIERIPPTWTSTFFAPSLIGALRGGKDALTMDDLVKLREAHYSRTLSEHDDRWWLATGRVGSKFVAESYAIEPNESRLARLTCPVHLFHGERDALALPQYVQRFERHARLLGRRNIHVTYEPGQPHGLDLNREGKPFYQNFFKALAEFKKAVTGADQHG